MEGDLHSDRLRRADHVGISWLRASRDRTTEAYSSSFLKLELLLLLADV